MMRIRPTFVVVAGLAAAIGIGVASCDDVQVIVAEAVTVEIAPASITIEVDESVRLQASVRDANGTLLGGRTVSWSSTDPSIATVDGEGNVLGRNVGVTTITARSGSATGSAQVLVESPPGFSLDRTAVSLSAASGAIAGPETVLISGTGANPTTGLNASIVYDQQVGDWLQVALSSTSTPASLQMSASTAGLAAGVYGADVIVRADDVPSQGIRVTLTVSQPPTIAISTDAVTLTAPQGGPDPGAQTVTVTNVGSDSIRGLQASVGYGGGQPSGWLTAILSGTRTPADLTLTASVQSLPQGTYTANVSLSSPDAVNSPQILPVTLVVGPALPRIQLGSTTVSFSTTVGGPDPSNQQVGVANAGGGTLDQLSLSVAYQGAQSGWLAASLNSTTAPASITLAVSAAGLPVGTHTATVTVASPAASNSPQVLTVRFTVGQPAAVLSLSSTSVSFSAWQNGTDPAGQAVTVTNAGGGTLDQLSTSVSYSGAQSGWLSAPISPTTAPATISLSATTAGLPQGTHNATVTVASPAASNSPQQIAVQFTVAAPPTIGFAPAGSVTLNGFTGGPQVVDASTTVQNAGGGGATALTGLSVTGDPAWMTVTLGSTSPATLSITADPSGLAQGTYNATLQISSTAPGVTNSPASFPVTFVVAPPPTISLSSSSVSMTGLELPGQPLGDVRQVSVTNGTAGGGANDLTGLGAIVNYSSGTSWLAATWNTTTSPATLTLTTDAHRNTLAPGTYDATVDVTSSVAGNSPQTVSVQFVVDNAPSIHLSATNLSAFSGTAGSGTSTPANQMVTLTNNGGGTANSITGISLVKSNDPVSGATCTAVAPDTNWITATLSSTTSPATITISVSAASLTAGSYCGRVTPTSSVAKNSGGPDIIFRFIVS